MWRFAGGGEWWSKGSGDGRVSAVHGCAYISGVGHAKRRFECKRPEWVSRLPRLFNVGQVDGWASGFNAVGRPHVALSGRLTVSRH